MQISRPAPEQIIKDKNWIINELENNKGYEFVSPNGYIFGFESKVAVLNWIADISWGGIQHGTMYGDKHDVNPNRVICAWLPDKWVNPGWGHGEEIIRVAEFIEIATKYIGEKWIS